MTAITADTQELTPASVWDGVAAGTIDDELLEWPPDVFALTDVILERSEAYRHALSPPPGLTWPPADVDDWDEAVVDAGRTWGGWIENGGEIPDLLTSDGASSVTPLTFRLQISLTAVTGGFVSRC